MQEQPAAHNAGQEVQLAGVLTKFHVAVDHQDEDEQNEVERQHGSQKLHLQVMYQARWFPYASTLAGDMLFDEINEIIASSKIGATVSKRCEKRIDTAILSHYTKAEIKRIKKKWNDSEIEPYFKKALGQTLDAYLRRSMP